MTLISYFEPRIRFLWKALAHGLKSLRRRPTLPLLQATLSALIIGVISGSLQVGESLDQGLREGEKERLGDIRQYLFLGPRTVSPRWVDQVPGSAAILKWTAMAIVEGRPGVSVQVLGVEPAFFEQGFKPQSGTILRTNEAWVNRMAQDALGLAPGMAVTLQLARPRGGQLDGPMSRRKPEWLPVEVRVMGPTPGGRQDRFDLLRSPSPPLTVYVDRTWLAASISGEDRANAFLFQTPIAAKTLEQRARPHWTLRDFGIRVRERMESTLLESEGIFFSQPQARKIGDVFPEATRIRTTLLKSLEAGGKSIPYLIASSETTPGRGPYKGEVWIDGGVSDWTHTQNGQVLLNFWTWAGDRSSRVESATFKLTGVFAVGDGRFGPEMFPDFPGMGGASCRDWDPGLPIDLSSITPWHEAHWNRHRGSPRVILHPEDMARYGADPGGQPSAFRLAVTGEKAIAEKLLPTLGLGDLGGRLVDTGELPKGSPGATDYGMLFLGVSMFLPVSLLVLLGLLLSLRGSEHRREMDILSALGFTNAKIIPLILAKDFLALVVAVPFGVLASAAFTGTTLFFLSHQSGAPWAHLPLAARWFSPTTLACAFGGTAVFIALGWAHLAGTLHGKKVPTHPLAKRRFHRLPFIALGASALVALGLFLWFQGQRDLSSFTVGAASLLGIFALVLAWISRQNHDQSRGKSLSVADLLRHPVARRPRATLLSPLLLATGIYICLSLGVFEGLLSPGEGGRGGGTGGFTHWIQIEVPWSPPISSNRGESLNQTVPLRRAAGEDASCLNPYQATDPTILGVPLAAMDGRFRFSKTIPGLASDWSCLRDDGGTNLKVAADSSILEWQWRHRLGEILPWRSPTGKVITLQLVGKLDPSILQGPLLADEKALLRLLPEVEGFGVLLGRFSNGASAEEAKRLLRSHGPTMETTTERLGRFARVEITYLRHFQVLSALALMVGLLGFTLLGWKELEKRHRERALFHALGFSPTRARFIALGPVVFDLALGAGTAFIALAVEIALRTWGGNFAGPSMTSWVPVLVGLLVPGFFFAWIAGQKRHRPALPLQD